MSTQLNHVELSARPSRLIAEALVGRHGPRLITTRAQSLGLSRQITEVMVVACRATATDSTWVRRRSFAATGS